MAIRISDESLLCLRDVNCSTIHIIYTYISGGLYYKLRFPWHWNYSGTIQYCSCCQTDYWGLREAQCDLASLLPWCVCNIKRLQNIDFWPLVYSLLTSYTFLILECWLVPIQVRHKGNWESTVPLTPKKPKIWHCVARDSHVTSHDRTSWN